MERSAHVEGLEVIVEPRQLLVVGVGGLEGAGAELVGEGGALVAGLPVDGGRQREAAVLGRHHRVQLLRPVVQPAGEGVRF